MFVCAYPALTVSPMTRVVQQSLVGATAHSVVSFSDTDDYNVLKMCEVARAVFI